jgi:5-formyltetrahydrofolate cyclo-ligase
MRMNIEKRVVALRLNLKVEPNKVEALTKKQIRSKILLILKTQKEADRDRKSKIIKDKLFRTLVFKKAKTLMFYISFDGEVNTQEMIKEAQKIGKTVTVPVCKSDRIIRPCILQHKAKLKKGLYGICEPAIKRFINVEYLDLVVAPGVAFDKKGNRLGRGKGCYDNLLKKLSRKATSIGLAFDFQILPFVPATITDTAVDRVIFA